MAGSLDSPLVQMLGDFPPVNAVRQTHRRDRRQAILSLFHKEFQADVLQAFIQAFRVIGVTLSEGVDALLDNFCQRLAESVEQNRRRRVMRAIQTRKD